LFAQWRADRFLEKAFNRLGDRMELLGTMSEGMVSEQLVKVILADQAELIHKLHVAFQVVGNSTDRASWDLAFADLLSAEQQMDDHLGQLSTRAR
jgi:hypothetical protein